MTEITETYLAVGTGAQARQIAIKYRAGAGTSTPLMWLGGFMSDMEGSKAVAVDELAAEVGSPCIRFDYSGHGASGGQFTDGTISRWLEEAVAVWTTHAGPAPILIGSSMGGWITLLLARYLTVETGVRPAAVILIAPASDMTRELMWDKFTEPQRKELLQRGALHIPSDYGDSPYVITQGLIEDGDRQLAHLGL